MSGHGVGKCNHWHAKGGTGCKTGPSTFPRDSIPPLFLGSYSSHYTLLGIWHLFWFLLFILLVDMFSFSPQRASLLVLPSPLPAVWFSSLSSPMIQLPNFPEAFSPLRHLLIARLDSKTQHSMSSSTCLLLLSLPAGSSVFTCSLNVAVSRVNSTPIWLPCNKQ